MLHGIYRTASTPLSEHKVLRSRSLDETSAFLRNKNIDLQAMHARFSRQDFRAAIDAAYLPRMYVAYMEYGIAARMTALAPLDIDYAIHLPLGGSVDLHTGTHSVHCETGCAAVGSPSSRMSVTASDRCRRLLVSVGREALMEHLATMLGDLPTEGLVFHPTAGSSRSGNRRLANAVLFAAQEFEHSGSTSGNDVVVAQFEQFLMSLLLMTQPNNYSERLGRSDNGVRPRDVKRAIDFIHANLGHAIVLDDLVAASGVPGRTLHQHFQGFVGTSPMSYVRKARFERVRDDLEKLDGGGTVTETAERWGFTHLGRFSAEYRRRFGELPSVTAGRRRPSRR